MTPKQLKMMQVEMELNNAMYLTSQSVYTFYMGTFSPNPVSRAFYKLMHRVSFFRLYLVTRRALKLTKEALPKPGDEVLEMIKSLPTGSSPFE